MGFVKSPINIDGTSHFEADAEERRDVVLQRQKHGSWRDQPVTGSRRALGSQSNFSNHLIFYIYPLLFFYFSTRNGPFKVFGCHLSSFATTASDF